MFPSRLFDCMSLPCHIAFFSCNLEVAVNDAATNVRICKVSQRELGSLRDSEQDPSTTAQRSKQIASN
jgi:hypothetical protein